MDLLLYLCAKELEKFQEVNNSKEKQRFNVKYIFKEPNAIYLCSLCQITQDVREQSFCIFFYVASSLYLYCCDIHCSK